jgi:hypothetical protein
MKFRLLSSLIFALPVLVGCSSYAPPDQATSMNRDNLTARMGSPDTVRQTTRGTRLEFPRGPYGKHTWFVDIDASGQVIRVEQVLTENNFNAITPGMAQDEVRQRLGRPGEVQGLARSRGHVWSYRYENYACQWFQVELTQDHKVRSTGYGQPPECMGHDEVYIP